MFFQFFITVLTGAGTPWPWTLISTNFPEQTQCHLPQMQILLSSSTEKFIKTPWPYPYLSSLMACRMHNVWVSYKITDFVERIHLCYKTQTGIVNTLWHAFQFQSGNTCIKSPDQTCQSEPWSSDSKAVAASWGDSGFPPYHFILCIDLMWTWTICPVLIAHVLLCSLIGGLNYRGTHNKSLCFLSQQAVPCDFLDNAWMWRFICSQKQLVPCQLKQ